MFERIEAYKERRDKIMIQKESYEKLQDELNEKILDLKIELYSINDVISLYDAYNEYKKKGEIK